MASRSFEVGGCAGLSFASRFSQMMICDSPPILSGCGLAHGEILGSAGIICSPTCDRLVLPTASKKCVPASLDHQTDNLSQEE